MTLRHLKIFIAVAETKSMSAAARRCFITQPTVSHHMKKLVDAGLITREQRGRWAHYSVVPEAFQQLRDLLDLS